MSFDFGEVLKRAWQITWKHKILWIFGFFSMALAFLFFPLGFIPMFSVLLDEDVPFWIEQPAFIFGYFGIFVLLMIGSLFLGALMQAAISVGALRAEQGSENISFRETLKTSLPYFWRFLAVGTLVGDRCFPDYLYLRYTHLGLVQVLSSAYLVLQLAPKAHQVSSP